jgi:hypothetical protein
MASGGVVIVVAMVVVALLGPSFRRFRRSEVGEALVGEARPGSSAPETDEDRPGPRDH